MKPADFIRANAMLIAPRLVPELRLYLATEVVPLWHKTEEELAQIGVPPPFWAFAWAGGQALARYILDHPEVVAGKCVLDIGAGSGLVGLAAMKSGAKSVLAADIDQFACAAIALNAAVNHLEVTVTQDDLIGRDVTCDVILVGDLFYERALAERLLAWLRQSDSFILLGDPQRNYFPKHGIKRLEIYEVQTTRDLEDREIRETGVFALSSGSAAPSSTVPKD